MTQPEQCPKCNTALAAARQAQGASEPARKDTLTAAVAWSQVQAFGGPVPKTWDDYEQGCYGTYGGGYQTAKEREIFHHGIGTVFNLLRHEFPIENFRGPLVVADERVKELERANATLREQLEHERKVRT